MSTKYEFVEIDTLRHADFSNILESLIFPEYSIPGLAGIAQVESILRTADWPPGAIVIGGIDAISKPDLATLINEPNTHMDTTRHSLADIGNEQWINCAFTWVKAADETVERWIQPKFLL